MTVEQIRIALDHMEENYSLAMGHKDYGLARAFKDKIDWLMAELEEENEENLEIDLDGGLSAVNEQENVICA